MLRDYSQGIVQLSQKSYINKVVNKFGIKHNKSWVTSITKGDYLVSIIAQTANQEIKYFPKLRL